MSSTHSLPAGRGEPQHFQRRICRCSAVLCLLALSQRSKLVKHFTSCVGAACWSSWGQHMSSPIAPVSDTACGHLLHMSDDCEEASQNQPMFCCDLFSPSVSVLQRSHREVLRGEAQRFLEAAFKTAKDEELRQEPGGVGLCCHAVFF